MSYESSLLLQKQEKRRSACYAGHPTLLKKERLVCIVARMRHNTHQSLFLFFGGGLANKQAYFILRKPLAFGPTP